MNLFKKSKYAKCGLMLFLTFAACILTFHLFYSFNLQKYLSGILGILMPFIVGFGLAYLLNPIANFFDRKVSVPLVERTKFKKKKSIARGFSVFLTEFLAITFIFLLLLILIPQLVSSFYNLLGKLPYYYETLNNFVSEKFSNNPELLQSVNEQLNLITSNTEKWMNSFANALPSMWNIISSGVLSVIGFFTNLVLGIVISFYVLFSKERFISQSKKALYAIFPKDFAQKSVSTCKESHIVFGSYITGVILDSTIIGILCFLGVWIMQMPYTVLIAVIVGVFNIIPFLGPFLGAIPAGFLILVDSPGKTIWFVIFIIVLQQFDGNILKPKVLGGTIGLPTFWILFAILVGGGLFGFLGMFLGVPVFSVIYTIISRWIDKKLMKKNLSAETSDYLE